MVLSSNGDICPVLKHGPRSLSYVQAQRKQFHARNESVIGFRITLRTASTDLDLR